MADVSTYPMTEEEKQRKLVESSAPLANTSPDVTGLNQPTVPTDLDSSSTATQPAPVGAPLPSGNANGALGGESEPVVEQAGNRDLRQDGGMPDQQQRNIPSDVQEQYINKFYSGVQAARADNKDLHIGQARELEKRLNDLGVKDVYKAAKEIVTEYEKKVDAEVVYGETSQAKGKRKKFAFRNVFDKISREEMPLFLMDFGMRAMMAGESMGDLGALGAAGAGAMGALQGRREAAEAKRVEDYGFAVKAGQKERELDISEQKGQAALANATIVEGDDGFYRIDLETGEMTPMTTKGGLQPKPKSKGRGEFRDEVAVQALVAAGYERNQANLIIYAGGKSEEEAAAIAEEVWTKNLDKGRPDFVSSSDWRNMSAAEKRKYENDWKDNFIKRVSVKRKAEISDDEAAQRALQATS